MTPTADQHIEAARIYREEAEMHREKARVAARAGLKDDRDEHGLTAQHYERLVVINEEKAAQKLSQRESA